MKVAGGGLVQIAATRHIDVGRRGTATLKAILLTVCAIAVGACNFPPGDPSSYVVNVENRTSSDLHFTAQVDNGIDLGEKVPANQTRHILYSLGPPPSSDVIFRGGLCTTVDIVAYDANEQEVARHPPGLCMRDTWVIGGAPPS